MATVFVGKNEGFFWGLLDIVLVVLFIMLIVWLVNKFTPVKLFSYTNGAVPATGTNVSINGNGGNGTGRMAA